MTGGRETLRGVAALALALLAGAPSAAHASDEFYVSRLHEGVEAFRGKRTLDAIDRLRIACFGLLDSPPLLEEGLAVLTLAYAESGRTGDVDSTLTRFLEVERRFGVYPKTVLSPELKTAFETRLRLTTKPEVLAGYPNLAALAKAGAATGGKKR